MVLNKSIFLFFFYLLLQSFPLSATVLQERIEKAGFDFILSVEGGGATTLIQIIDKKGQFVPLLHQGKEVTEIQVGGTNINVIGAETMRKTLGSIFKNTKIKVRAKADSDKYTSHAIKNLAPKILVICGMAGASSEQRKKEIQQLFEPFGFKKSHVIVLSDVELATGLIDDKDGIILIAGGGSIALGQSYNQHRRVGGLGYLLGDEGSGAYIGKLAIKRCLDYLFGYGKPTLLKDTILKYFNVPGPTELISAFYRKNDREKVDAMTQLAPIVFSLAYNNKDEVAQEIIQEAAQQLAELIKLAIHIFGDKDNIPIYAIGGLFKDKNSKHFIDLIIKNIPNNNNNTKFYFLNLSQENIVLEVVKKFLKA